MKKAGFFTGLILGIALISLVWLCWYNINKLSFPEEFKDKYTTNNEPKVNFCIDCPDGVGVCEEKECKPTIKIEDAKVYCDTTPHLQLIKAQTEQIQCFKEKCISFAPPGCD